MGGTLAKIANEVIDLQKTEVAELEEPFHRGKVGSSTMPHKRNPSACEHVVALGRLLHAQVAPALQSMVAAHERDKRAGVTEQAVLPEVSCLLAGMLRGTRGILSGLQVYPERMQENLGLLDGLLLSEAVMLALARHIGRQRAHEVVYELCMDAVEGAAAPAGSCFSRIRGSAPYLGPAELDTCSTPPATPGSPPASSTASSLPPSRRRSHHLRDQRRRPRASRLRSFGYFFTHSPRSVWIHCPP